MGWACGLGLATQCLSASAFCRASAWNTHLGRLTFTVPTGTISRDFPQNLFFHFMSGVGLREGEGQQ